MSDSSVTGFRRQSGREESGKGRGLVSLDLAATRRNCHGT